MRRSRGESLFDVWNYTTMLILSLTILFPIMIQVTTSLSPPVDVMRDGLRLIPNPATVTLESYRIIFRYSDIPRAIYYSVFRTTVGTVLTMLVCGMLAYPLSKKYLPLRRAWALLIIFTLFFRGGLIPAYMLIRSLGLINTPWALILPVVVNPFYIIIMRNFFMVQPVELEESAKLDGAGAMTVFLRILIPLSMPMLATVSLWSMVFHWNSWFDATIYITKPDIKVLQTVLRRVLNDAGRFGGAGVNAEVLSAQLRQERLYTPESIKSAILMVTITPIVLVYPFLQKFFVKGVLMGSIKG
jgi:putative aldouronate transport system permease protein